MLKKKYEYDLFLQLWYACTSPMGLRSSRSAFIEKDAQHWQGSQYVVVNKTMISSLHQFE